MPVPDFSPGEVLTASAMDSIGLWKIDRKTFSGATSVDFTNVFSSSYDNYRVIFQQYSCTAAMEMMFQLRDSGGPVTTSNYDSGRIEQLGGTINAFTYTAASSWTTTYVSGSGTAGSFVSGIMDIYQPNLTAYTKFTAQMARSDSAVGGIYTVNSQGMFRLTTQMTGFSLIRPGSSTISGTISVYGYNK